MEFQTTSLDPSSDGYSESDKDSEYKSILTVGGWFLDLAQFHNLSSPVGWVGTDLSNQSPCLVISDGCGFKAYSKKNEDDFEKLIDSTLVVLLKYPGKQQFLVYSVQKWQLFTVNYGRLHKQAAQNRLQKFVDKCLRIVQYSRDKDQVQEVNGFVLLNNEVSVCRNLLLREFLSRKVYDGPSDCKAMIELKSTWITDETATAQTMYQSFFEYPNCQLMTSSKHHLDFKTIICCKEVTGDSFICPSQVPIKLAFNVLNQMHDRTWSLSQPVLETSKVFLESLLCDIDSGIFYLKAKSHNRSVSQVITLVKSVLTKEILKTQVSYVPSGMLHQTARQNEKPTIEPAGEGVFIKLQDPYHMTEVAKSWFWMKTLPTGFFSLLQDVMCEVAKEILCSDHLGSTQIGINILDLRHSRIATNIPGGMLLVFSAFLILSQAHQDLRLVIETYNNKSKGLVSKADVTAPFTFQKTAEELESCILENNSIFQVISEFCRSCAELDENMSTISYGFRTIHKDNTSFKNVHSCIIKPSDDLSKCQIYPMAFMHPAICPFLYHHEEGCEIVRTQTYQESWSAHKNIDMKQARKVVAQNLNKAIEKNVLNLSVLRSNLPHLATSLDASFKNWHDTSGTRYEVAVRPKLSLHSNKTSIFDLRANLTTVWQYLEASFIFSDIDSVTTFSSVCTAAVLLGYRASLDALKDSDKLEANLQCSILEYMRYLNAIIHAIPSGRFVSNNPKLFLATLGFISGRPLALTPTLPLQVRFQIVSFSTGLRMDAEDAQLALMPCQNAISARIDILKGTISLSPSMVMCSCGMGFFGCDRVAKLHVHLVNNPRHNSDDYKEKSITGSQWFATFVEQKQQLEQWIWNCGTKEQQALFQNASSGKNTCCVGKAGTGKTFGVKKIHDYLEMIFLYPGEIVRIAPLGRVAQHFHYEARTVHSTMRLYMDTDSWSDDDVVRYLESNKFEVFAKMKVLIGLEMFVMMDCILMGLLKYIRTNHPDTLLLFEGDPIQLSMGKGSQIPVLCQPDFDSMLETIVFDTQKRITNPEQQAALDAMRIAQANTCTLAYWNSKIVEKIDDSCLTIYALKKKAETHNESMLQSYEKKFQTKRIQSIAIDACNGKIESFPQHIERNCTIEKMLSIVPGAPIFFTRNINAKLCSHVSKKETYIGNGTPGTVVQVESACIRVRLDCGSTVEIVPFPFDIDGGEGYTRTQYPLILGWASSIHKVQGMQFAKIRVDFCLNLKNIIKDASSNFYRGMAYMAFSRSECVEIIGPICIELLNNVNPDALRYWLQKQREWTYRNSNKPQARIFRDAIHAQNFFSLQKFKEHHSYRLKPATASAFVPDTALDVAVRPAETDYVSTTPAVFNALDAAPALTSDQTTEVAASDPSKKYKERHSVYLSTAFDSAFTPDTTVLDVVNTSVQPAAIGFISDRAVSFPVHTSTSASASSCASVFDQAYSHSEEYDNVDINIDDVYTDSAETTTVHAEPAPAPSLDIAVCASKSALADAHTPAQHHVMIRANYSGSVSQAWKLQNRDDRIRLVAELWTKTHDQVFPKLGKTYWEGGMKFREGSRGYGEASINVCLLMLEVLDDLYPMQLRKISPPFFVDIGSGLGNIVLQMSALQPDLKCSFGIELERPRAAFAMEACRVFTANASNKNVLFCQIQAQEGNCFEDACCKQALMSAGIVWINNEIFSPDDNLKVFEFLNSLVPVHCIIMSFVELLVTKRSSKTTPLSNQPYDFVVHTPRQVGNACSWLHPETSKQIFIIQRKTANFALEKNDHMISSR